jgi:hypothetical protein
MSHTRNRIEIFLWFAAWIGLFALLQRLGRDTYALPASNLDAYRTWFHTAEPTVVVFALTRVAAMIAIGYVVVTTIVCAVAHRTTYRRFMSVIDALTIPGARSVAVRLAAMSAVGALTAPATAAFATAPSEEVPALRMLAPGEEPAYVSTPPSTTVAPSEPPARHVVQRGENFWTIAQAHLVATLEREPDDGEVVEYWRAIVDANKQQLKSTEDPDLIFAGQVIDLPSIEHESIK